MNGNGNGQSVHRFSGTSVILHCIITFIIGQQDYGNWGRIKMKVIKVDGSHILIEPEDLKEQEYLETQIGWKDKGKLQTVYAELKGYYVLLDGEKLHPLDLEKCGVKPKCVNCGD